MTLPQDQVYTLHEKIDALHRLIEQLSGQISLVLAKTQETSSVFPSNQQFSEDVVNVRRSIRQLSALDEEMIGHKDVLSESEYIGESDRATGDQLLSSEVQVQRLTAQLTAAYNRIAALEDQLLSHRIH